MQRIETLRTRIRILIVGYHAQSLSPPTPTESMFLPAKLAAELETRRLSDRHCVTCCLFLAMKICLRTDSTVVQYVQLSTFEVRLHPTAYLPAGGDHRSALACWPGTELARYPFSCGNDSSWRSAQQPLSTFEAPSNPEQSKI